MASDRFTERMSDRTVAHDMRVVADFTRIWCNGHHRDAPRAPIGTAAAALGIYRKRCKLCAGCTAHLAYAEKRRAYCPKDPKPFCAHCDSQCYSPGEQEWQRTMMRYSGPRSLLEGHAIDGVRHVLEARRYRRHPERQSSAGTAETKERT